MPRARRSAGLLLHRVGPSGTREVLIAHMGGPFWARKDEGAWTIPKGEHEEDEPSPAAARREFREELGLPVPDGDLVGLGGVTLSSRKVVTVFAMEADLDLRGFSPGTFELQWPPRSGRRQQFPEVDRAAWVDFPTARRLLVAAQVVFIERLAELLG